MTARTKLQFMSVLFCAVIWSGLTVAFIEIPVQVPVKDPDYHEIRIQLSPAPETQADVPEQAEMQEDIPEMVEAEPETPAVPEPVSEEIVFESPAPAPKAAEPAPVKAPEPAPVKAAETQVKAPEPPEKAEPAPAAKTPVPAPEPAKQTFVKSVDQLMAEQNASKGTKKSAAEVDWDALFGDDASSKSAVSTGEKTFATQMGPSLSGSSAASSTSDTGTAASASSGKVENSEASEITASILSGIVDAANSAPVTAASRSSADSQGSPSGVIGGTGTGSDSDGLSIDWGGKPGRKAKNATKITFTPEQEALITASIRDIRISFKVRADGTVLRDSIMIDKKAMIPAQISQEIERQISEWIFETGISDGQAVLSYSIIKE